MSFRKFLVDGWEAVTVALGLVAAGTSLLGSWFPMGVIFAITYFLASIRWTALPVAATFVAMSADAYGVSEIAVAGLPLTAAKAAVGLSFITFMISRVISQKRLYRFNLLHAGFSLVVASMLIAVGTAASPGLSFPMLASLIMVVVMFTLFEAALEPEQLLPVARVIAVTTTIVMLSAVFGSERVASDGTMMRTAGGFNDPNEWCVYLTSTVPVAGSILLQSSRRADLALVTPLLVLYPLAVFASYSRAGLLGLVAVAPVMLYGARHRWREVLALSPVILLFAARQVKWDKLLSRYATLLSPDSELELNEGSLTERSDLLEAGLLIIQDHPILGVGLGMFPRYAAYVTAGKVWKAAHNTYLTVVAEQGLIGLLAHLGLLVTVVLVVWRAFRAAQEPVEYGVCIGYTAAGLGFAVMALTLNLMDFAPFYLVTALLLVVERRAGGGPVWLDTGYVRRDPARSVKRRAEAVGVAP